MRWRILLPLILGLAWLGGAYYLLMRYMGQDASVPSSGVATNEGRDAGAGTPVVAGAETHLLRARVTLHSGEALTAWIDIEVEGESTEAREHCRNLATAQAARLASIEGMRGEVARSCALESLPPIPAGVTGAFGLWEDLGEEGASPSPGIVARLHEVSVAKDEPACLKMLEAARKRRARARLEAAVERRRFLRRELDKRQTMVEEACKKDPAGGECVRLQGVVGLLQSRLTAAVEPAADLLRPDPGLRCKAL